MIVQARIAKSCLVNVEDMNHAGLLTKLSAFIYFTNVPVFRCNCTVDSPAFSPLHCNLWSMMSSHFRPFCLFTLVQDLFALCGACTFWSYLPVTNHYFADSEVLSWCMVIILDCQGNSRQFKLGSIMFKFSYHSLCSAADNSNSVVCQWLSQWWRKWKMKCSSCRNLSFLKAVSSTLTK